MPLTINDWLWFAWICVRVIGRLNTVLRVWNWDRLELKIRYTLWLWLNYFLNEKSCYKGNHYNSGGYKKEILCLVCSFVIPFNRGFYLVPCSKWTVHLLRYLSLNILCPLWHCVLEVLSYSCWLKCSGITTSVCLFETVKPYYVFVPRSRTFLTFLCLCKCDTVTGWISRTLN